MCLNQTLYTRMRLLLLRTVRLGVWRRLRDEDDSGAVVFVTLEGEVVRKVSASPNNIFHDMLLRPYLQSSLRARCPDGVFATLVGVCWIVGFRPGQNSIYHLLLRAMSAAPELLCCPAR